MPVPAQKTAPVNGQPTKTPAKRKPKTAQSVREVIHPRYETLICCHPKPDLLTGEMVQYDDPITVEIAKKLLGWETEDEFVRRELTDDPDQKESKLRASDFLLKDRHGNKIRCKNNTVNRPFDLQHAKKLCQDILSHKYVLNLEDIIVGCTGLVLSGQHRLIGLVLAGEQWELQQHWQDLWDCEPYIESVVAVGADESQATLQTYDNVKPRALSDTIYTSALFANKSASDKKACSVMLDTAVDWLWRRLDATSNKFVEHQTHSASLDFLERHGKMVAAVKHLHDLDDATGGHAISNSFLNRGKAAGMLVLMGCSGTSEEDAETYHALGSPKKQSQLDWKNWDRALQFWSDIGQGRLKGTRKNEKGRDEDYYETPEWVGELKKALANLNNENYTDKVTDNEKAAVVALAWAEYVRGNEFFTVEDLVPETAVNPVTNTRYLVDDGPTFGGPDKGPGKQDRVDAEPDPTPEEIEERKEEARKRRAEELEARTKGRRTTVKADVEKKVVPTPSPKNEGPLKGEGKKYTPTDDGDLTREEVDEATEEALSLEASNEFSLADEDALTEHMNAETIANTKAARKEAREAKKRK